MADVPTGTNYEEMNSQQLQFHLDKEFETWQDCGLDPARLETMPIMVNELLNAMLETLVILEIATEEEIMTRFKRRLLNTLQSSRVNILEQRKRAEALANFAVPTKPSLIGPDGKPLSV